MFRDVILPTIIMAVAGITGIFLFIYIGISFSNRMEFPTQVAQIEQLRADVQHTNVANNEDVIGQVTQMNQFISEQKARNALWYYDLTIPDGWDEVRVIRIPGAKMPWEE